MKKILILLFTLFFYNQPLKAETYFLDFKYILNESDAGKKAQSNLKKTLENGFKKLTDREKKLQEEEKKIIQQKKVISAEEYKKKITELRIKVSTLQKDRNKLLESVSKKRGIAKAELLKNLNPIVKNYMQEKNIKIVLDKKSILLGDEKLDITKDIMTTLNSKLKSIKLD
jgi:outer membrane protein